MTSNFRPLLAASIDNDEQLEALTFPLVASPKVDGIRVLCHPELGPVTRSLKPIPSRYIRGMLSIDKLKGLDGEVVVGPIAAPDVFNKTTSGVMTHDSEPDDFTYWTFDFFRDPTDTYYERWVEIAIRHEYDAWDHDVQYVRCLPLRMCNDITDVLAYERECLGAGFEGIMLRHTEGGYKHGRSTLKQQILMKLKRWKDAEATIVGFEPLYSNQNPQTRDSLGLAERSDHKAGMVEIQTLGALRVQHDGFGEFNVGSGLDAATRDDIWQRRDTLLGRRISFKYQEVGVVDKPRFPIFKGFRPEE